VARVFYLGVSVGSSFPHAFGDELAALIHGQIRSGHPTKTLGDDTFELLLFTGSIFKQALTRL
jgi:hypothetical protein